MIFAGQNIEYFIPTASLFFFFLNWLFGSGFEVVKSYTSVVN